MRVGVKASMSPLLSAEHCKSTMSPQWKIYPSSLQTLDDHQQLPEQHAESLPCRYSGHSIILHQLMFTSLDDESPVRPSKHCSQYSSTDDGSCDLREVDASASVHHNLCHPVVPTPTANPFLTSAWDDDTTSSEENFPTAPLDDYVLSEDPIQDRCLCIHETPDKPNHQCSFSCPY